MICFSLIALTLTAYEPTIVTSRIVSASIFRAGLALVTREVSVPTGPGTYTLDVVPEAIDGGFWYGSPDGAKIRDVTTKLAWTEKTIDFTPRTLGDIMAANVGKRIRIALPKYPQPEPEWISGTLLRMDEPPNGLAFIKQDNGNMRVILPTSITEIDMNGLDSIWKRKIKVPNVHIDFEVDAAKPSRIRWTTLEVGPAWSPSYLLELFPMKEAELTAKVQLGLPGWKFEQTDVQLLTGKPVVNTDWAADLSSAQGTIANYIQRSGPLWPNDKLDPFDGFLQANRGLASYGGNYYGGGFGGQGGGGFGGAGGGSEGYTGQAYSDTRTTDFFAREPEINRTGGVFAYPMGKLSLNPGDRVTRVMFDSTGKAERIVELRLGDNQAFSDQIEVENTGKLPWTGGRCTVLNDGTPLAILNMPFTNVGKTALLTLGAVVDLIYSNETTDVVGEPYKQGNATGVPTRWRTEKISFTNSRDEVVNLRLIYMKDCIEMKADGAKIVSHSSSNYFSLVRSATIQKAVKPGGSWEYLVKYRVRL